MYCFQHYLLMIQYFQIEFNYFLQGFTNQNLNFYLIILIQNFSYYQICFYLLVEHQHLQVHYYPHNYFNCFLNFQLKKTMNVKYFFKFIILEKIWLPFQSFSLMNQDDDNIFYISSIYNHHHNQINVFPYNFFQILIFFSCNLNHLNHLQKNHHIIHHVFTYQFMKALFNLNDNLIFVLLLITNMRSLGI